MTSLVKDLVKLALPAAIWERFRARWWRYVRPLTVDYCPVAMPWFHAVRYDDPIAKLHRLAFQFYWQDRWSFTTFAALVIAMMAWPFRVVGGIVRESYCCGAPVRAQTGRGLIRQFLDMLRLALKENVPPFYYYVYRLYHEENKAQARWYLFESEMSMLYPKLSATQPSDSCLRFKHLFYEHCLQYDLPTTETLALFENGAVGRWYYPDAGRLPCRDLVFKPVDLACGRGFQLWSYVGLRQTWERDRLELDEASLLDYCSQSADSHPYILQCRLTNHPALAGLCGNGLSTARIVTYHRTDGEFGILLVCFRMPVGGSLVDNMDAGGIVAPIDVRTGVLGRAISKSPRRGEFVYHPNSNASIEGTRIPYFDEACELAVRAHNSFSEFAFVGWDVVVTADGPILLEANPDWSVELVQLATNRPLGKTVYPENFLDYIGSRKGNVGATQRIEASTVSRIPVSSHK